MEIKVSPLMPIREDVKKSGKLYLWIVLNIYVLTCSPPGSQSAAITTPLCPERARSGVLRTENSSLSSVSVPMWKEYVKVSISYQFRVISSPFQFPTLSYFDLQNIYLHIYPKLFWHQNLEKSLV